jgi:hypothetical protein
VVYIKLYWIVTSWYFIPGHSLSQSLLSYVPHSDEPSSSVSIVSDYGLDDRAIGVRSSAEDFDSDLCVQTGPGAHPVPCPIGSAFLSRG